MTSYPPGPHEGGYGPGGGPDQFGAGQFGAGPPQAPPMIVASTKAATPPANTMATLSLIFAFVFAPVGAVLGHLGLSQIRRTGEPGRERAVIGLAVSYAVTAIAVIGLVVWIATPGTSTPAKTAAPHPSGAASKPSAGAKPAPGDDSVPSPLLTPTEMTAALGSPIGGNGAAPAGFAVTSTFTEPTGQGVQGTVDPATCESEMFAGTEAGLGDTGYSDVHGVTMQSPGEQPYTVTEVVATYPDASAAQQALAGYRTKLNGCHSANGRQTCAVTLPDGKMSGEWTCGGMKFDLPLGDRGSSGCAINHFYRGGIQNGSLQVYGSDRVVFTKGTSLIDVASYHPGLNASIVRVAVQITGRIG